MSSSSADAFDVHDHAADDDAFLAAVIPPGFVFKPNDREILNYLSKKISNEELPPNRIKSVKLYEYNVDTLIEKYKAYGKDEWYFFTPRGKRYPKRSRPSRTAKDGYWKATTGETNIYSKTDKSLIGYKMVLNFYYGKSPKGVKTNWIMHEYVVEDDPTDNNGMQLNQWVLCKIHRANYRNSSSSSPSPSTYNENKRMKTAIDVESSSSPSPSAYLEPLTLQGGPMLEANHNTAGTTMLPMSPNMIINGSSSADAATHYHEHVGKYRERRNSC